MKKRGLEFFSDLGISDIRQREWERREEENKQTLDPKEYLD